MELIDWLERAITEADKAVTDFSICPEVVERFESGDLAQCIKMLREFGIPNPDLYPIETVFVSQLDDMLSDKGVPPMDWLHHTKESQLSDLRDVVISSIALEGEMADVYADYVIHHTDVEISVNYIRAAHRPDAKFSPTRATAQQYIRTYLESINAWDDYVNHGCYSTIAGMRDDIAAIRTSATPEMAFIELVNNYGSNLPLPSELLVPVEFELHGTRIQVTL